MIDYVSNNEIRAYFQGKFQILEKEATLIFQNK